MSTFDLRFGSTSDRFTLVVALLVASIGFPSGCRDDDSASDLKRKLERRAANRPPEASLRLGVIHHLDGVPVGGPVSVRRDEMEIEVQSAHLVVSAIEVHACEPGLDDYSSPEGKQMLNGLWDRLVPPVRAHVPSSSTRLGTPFVEDLLAESGRAHVIGALAPPPATYCRLYAVVAPADRDISNPTKLPTDAIRGESLLVRGRWRSGPEADWRDFQISTDEATAIELRAVDPRTGESPLTLTRSGSGAMVLIDKRIDPTLFEVDVRAPDSADTLLTQLADRFRIHTFP